MLLTPPTPPRALWLGSNDWANCCHRVARAMNATAGKTVARVWTYNSHPFGYPEDVTGAEPTEELREWIAAAPIDWLATTGDGQVQHFPRMLAALGLPTDGSIPVMALQVGSACRNDPHGTRERDMAIPGCALRVPGADLLRFYRDDDGAIPYLAPAEDVVHAVLLPSAGKFVPPLRVMHAPSNANMKGTVHIAPIATELCERYGAHFDLVQGVSPGENLRRMESAAIFIDQLCFAVGGFGMSVMEAMGRGCCVVSHTGKLMPEIAAYFPPPPIVYIASEHELRKQLGRLLRDPAEALWRAEASLRWAAEVASPEAVARYWWRHMALSAS